MEQDKVNELHERLKNVEGRLGKREDNRQLIIDRRFAELTGDATLAWDTYSDSRVLGTTVFQYQTLEPAFTPRSTLAPSSMRRVGNAPYNPEASYTKERRSPARTLGRVLMSPLNRRTEAKKKRAAIAEAEKKPSDAAAFQQKAGDLQQKARDLQQEIQEQVQSLRKSTSGGSASVNELDAAIDRLHELKDRLDSLNSLDESTPSGDSQ